MRRLPGSESRAHLPPSAAALGLVVTAAALGCATAKPQPAAGPAAPVRLEMEPMMIEAVPGPAGVQIESFDAQELFEQGGAALSQSHHDEAIRYYEKLL